MRTVHLETGRHLYGGAAQVLHIVRGLVERGEDAILVAPLGSAIQAEAGRSGIPVRGIAFGGEADLRFVFRFRRLLRELGPELVHLHSRRGADTLGWLAARWAGIPAVLSRRVDNPEPRWLARMKYARFDRVIAISEEIRRVLLSEGVDPDRVVTVRSAIDTAAGPTGCGDRDAFLAEFSLPAQGRVAGMAAQFIERKGHDVLLDAIPAVVASVPEARFVLFGRGPLEERIRDRIAREGLSDYVRVAGFREDLRSLLPCLDLVVHPAFKEGLGVALLEAGAAGLPVVASRAGGIPEVVVDGSTGLLTEPGNPTALAEALIRVMGDAERCSEMGRAARRFVEEERSVAAMVEGNLRVYRSVVAARRT